MGALEDALLLARFWNKEGAFDCGACWGVAEPKIPTVAGAAVVALVLTPNIVLPPVLAGVPWPLCCCDAPPRKLLPNILPEAVLFELLFALPNMPTLEAVEVFAAPVEPKIPP